MPLQIENEQEGERERSEIEEKANEWEGRKKIRK